MCNVGVDGTTRVCMGRIQNKLAKLSRVSSIDNPVIMTTEYRRLGRNAHCPLPSNIFRTSYYRCSPIEATTKGSELLHYSCSIRSSTMSIGHLSAVLRCFRNDNLRKWDGAENKLIEATHKFASAFAVVGYSL